MRTSTKDTLRFILGAGLLVYETVLEHADRPWLIVAALGLLGYGGVSQLAERLK